MDTWLKKFFTFMRGKKLFTTHLVVGVIISAFFGGLFIFHQIDPVHAQTVQPNDFGIAPIGEATGFQATDIRLTIARIVRTALGFLGTISFVLCLYAGFLWMTAGGNDEKISQAKKILVNAAIGLVIISSAYGLTTYLITQILEAVNGPGGTTTSSSLGCTGPDCIGGGGGGSTGNVFYVNNLPAAGNVCVQNVHPSIVFNRDVDIATVQDSITVQKKSTASAVAGVWQYGAKKTMITFVPQGVCGTGGSNDCFEPSTDYQVQFKNSSAIKSLDNLTLNCSLKAGCKPVDFTSGTGVEVNPPRITVLTPSANMSFPVGEVVPFTISYESDSGVQNISLYQGGALIGGQTITGCAATGTVSLSWPTAGLPAASYMLDSYGTGWSGKQGVAQTPLKLAPLHCFDATLDSSLGEIQKGPPACGGECGSCGGDTCKDNSQCASGYCDMSGSGSAGICVDRMKISDLSPRSGAPGTYVTVAGLYFGTTPGAVYFPKVANPNPANLTQWIKANLVACIAGVASWSTAQILVEVPVGAVSGPLLVVTAPQVGKDNVSRTFTDATNDAWGSRLGDFQITTQVHPGLCAIKPAEGMAGDAVQLLGKNFGFLDTANDTVSFGDIKSVVIPTDWTDSLVKTTVPALQSSLVGVKISSNGIESNAVRFVINGGENLTNPLISNTTPSAGPAGEYITITGKNFGSNVGAVWFKQTAQSEAILGDFTFPAACQGDVWRDDQIIVKFPQGKGIANTSYALQIKTADNKISTFENAPTYVLKSGTPSPGICKISPLSGTSPFPANQTMTISGEYFGTNSQIYFWKPGANSSSIDGRLVADPASIVKASDGTIELKPPAGISSGPVVVLRPADKLLSNPEQFQVVDCVKNNNTCPVAGSVCCTTGPEVGMCKAVGDLCEGTLRSTAYIWRFSTNDIPKIPQVVERCNADVDAGQSLPTPSPSTIWSNGSAADDQVNVCRTALVTVEFNTTLDQATVNGSSVKVMKCASVSGTVCVSPVAVPVTPDSFTLQTAATDRGGLARNYLSIAPVGGKFNDASWYQVVFNKTITSVARDGKAVPLQVDRPCSTDSAYCFLFKTGAQDCKMKAVVITPYSYWTSVLEAPMKYHAAGYEKRLDYTGNGLSDQHCIMMNVDNFSWSWGTGDKTYSQIFGPDTVRTVQASAIANTVGVGLSKPDDAVAVNATARQAGNTYAGTSPLTIDLNNPDVVDYWPRCQEACTIGEVAVKFNTTMSNRNLPGMQNGGSVQLMKCLDENCLSRVSVLSTNDVYLDEQSGYTVLKVANSRFSSSPLEANTLYQVLVSSSSTDPMNTVRQLWSAARLNDPSTFSRPYNNQFTWRFKTKKDSCRIDHVEVDPKNYVAQNIKERATFQVQPYSSPDSCSAKGQKLNSWLVGWNWSSSDEKVATLNTYSTRGSNPACTVDCVRRGSDLPATVSTTPVCGNGVIEAGEDCEKPDKANGCGLDCRFMGNTTVSCGNGTVEPDKGEACDTKDPKTQIGCSTDCRNLGAAQTVSALSVTASICGSGSVGSGKDCDTRIAGDLKNPASSMLCSAQCLHLGTQLSSAWCSDNRLTKAGFTSAEFDAACAKSLSQCGNGIQEPEEDAGCDTVTGWNSTSCDQFCLKKKDTQCVPGSEGCDSNGRLIGSSLNYVQPSVCGDGVVGIGEVPFCENSLIASGHQGLIDPWALALGKGLGTPAGDPPTQSTNVKASTNQNTNGGTVSAQGTFAIACGFSSDLDCQASFGADYGVGVNSCCTLRPKLISTYPVNKTPNSCPNTYLEAVFDSMIDSDTLTDGIIIARGAASCTTSVDVTDQVAFAPKTHENQSWFARAYEVVARAISSVWGTTAEAVSPRWCVASDTGKAEIIAAPEVSATASRLRVKLTAPLAKDSDYAIILKNSIKTAQGVAVSASAGKPISWTFTTISQVCELKTVTVEPANWAFTKVGASTTLVAKAATTNGTLIQGIPGLYNWQYSWGPVGDPSLAVQAATSSEVKITAQNRNGEVMVRAAAVLTENTMTSATGTVAAGQSRVIVLLCENPWPPKDLYLGTTGPFTIFPFEDAPGNNDGFDLASNTFNNTSIPATPVTRDGYFNFGTYYCADKGSPGTFDDLPYLRGTVQIAPTVVSPTTSLKRFLFTNSKNNDVVGLQIFPNPNHLTAAQWYSLDRGRGGQGFAGSLQNITVNGFEAVSDGNNIYIDGLNYSSSTKALYSNIYLLSINSNATPETRAVFEQLVKNFKLTINLTNYGYCANPGGVPDFTAACRVDFDCAGGTTCSATVDKLKRNYDRLRGLHSLQSALASYAQGNGGAYPILNEGTYLKGQVISTWPAWDDFGSALGGTAPRDPVNVLGVGGTCSVSTNRFCTLNADCPAAEKCVLHDPATGWSTTDRRFSFACATSSLAYRYVSVSSTNYLVRGVLEDPGIAVSNLDAFIKDFVDTNKFILTSRTGICNQDQEISTLNQGRCGDGVVNYSRGEECDPQGRTRYGVCSAEQMNKVRVDVCSADCKYTPSTTPFIACAALSACGNGKVEAGEMCDEGVLNGGYNHCSKTCTWPPTNPPGYCGDGMIQAGFEICDYKAGLSGKNGVCAEGAQRGLACNTDGDCRSPSPTSTVTGRCQLFTPATGRYGASTETACGLDCRSPGPRCGDGVVQADFGEECDGSLQCTVSGVPGIKSCTSDCRYTESGLVAWWRFDDLITSNYQGEEFKFFNEEVASSSKFKQGVPAATICFTQAGEPCPDIVPGKYHSALRFNGKHSVVLFSTFDDPSHIASMNSTDALTVEAWVNPSARGVWPRIIEKGGFDRDGGYTFQLDKTGERISLVVWNIKSVIPFGTTGDSVIPLNQWTHVVGTFERQGNSYTVKVYVNGKLDGSIQKTVPTGTVVFAPSMNDGFAAIGSGSGFTSAFTGLIDEVKVYNKTLSPAEVADRAQQSWACALNSTASVAAAVPAGCGDGKVDPGEACDRGSQNGQTCSPQYNKTCSYCSNDCKNIIDVQPKQYCGNGVIEGPEICELDTATNVIYAAGQDSTTKPVKYADRNGYEVLSCADEPAQPYTVKKGTKSCAAVCSVIQSNCVICGKDDAKGVIVQGGIINVLDPKNQSPLLGAGGFGDGGKIDITLSNVYDKNLVGHAFWPYGTSYSSYSLRPPNEDGYSSSNFAKIGSDSRCSFGDGPTYKMYFNSDNTHQFDFPIVAKPASWQYDLVVSPVINQAQRPNDIRVVVRWVGNTADFIPGFLNDIDASGNPATMEAPLFSPTQKQDYWSDPSWGSVWFHGLGTTAGATNEMAFSVNTGNLYAGRYVFFIRLPQQNPADPGISRYAASSKLAVDLYFPENDSVPYHFGKPSFTYYLNQAQASDNPSAPYWQVFDLKTDPAIVNPADRVVPLQKITTKPYLPL